MRAGGAAGPTRLRASIGLSAGPAATIASRAIRGRGAAAPPAPSGRPPRADAGSFAAELVGRARAATPARSLGPHKAALLRPDRRTGPPRPCGRPQRSPVGVDGVDGLVRRIEVRLIAKRRECNGQVDGVAEPLG